MDVDDAITRLSALATPSRIAILKLLAHVPPPGELKSGEIAEQLGVKQQSTLSTQLMVLSNARLVRYRRDGRSIIYRLDLDAVRELVGFIVNEVAAGKVELAPPPKGTRKRVMM
jgi:ArsR family transcriptional regulator